jgi:hypothetical protein
MHRNSRSGGWSTSGKIVASNVNNTEVKLQADFAERGPDGQNIPGSGAGKNYTVQFNIRRLSGGNDDSPPIQAEAVIQWTVEGNFVTRRVSVSNGTSVTGTGQACKVVVTDKSQTNNGVTPITYEVDIQITPGTRGSYSQPPCWVPTNPPGDFNIANGGALVIQLPDDLGAISAATTVFSGAAIADGTTQVLMMAGNNILKTYDAKTPGFVPMAPGTNKIVLTNNSGDAALFSLTVGVDG